MPGLSSTSRPERGTNGWAPSSVIILHDDHVRTSVRFSGLEPSRQLDAKWRVRARLFGRHPLRPLWEIETDEIAAYDSFEVTSEWLAKNVGLEGTMHYAEFHPYSEDIAPINEQIVAPLFAHYSSTDGSFSAHLPSSYIYGSARAYKLGATGKKYQQFPCVEIQPPFELEIYTVNPNLRKVQYSVRLVGENGIIVDDGPYTIGPKAIGRWCQAGVDTSGLGRSAGVIIASDVRLSSFVGTRHARADRLVGLDHTHPFFPG